MVVNLAAGQAERSPRTFPYSNWGPGAAILGLFAALFLGALIGLPAEIIDHAKRGELSTWASIFVQLATEVSFLSVPIAIAWMRGAGSLEGALSRLGVRSFQPSALRWMAASIGAYLVLTVAYSTIVGPPKQENIAEHFGSVPIQFLLIVLITPFCEEVCFRGMLFAGLREKLPRVLAALISGTIFGALHGFTGVSTIPPLIAFGVILALLYEKTGSVVPGVLLHMLNNSVALLGQ